MLDCIERETLYYKDELYNVYNASEYQKQQQFQFHEQQKKHEKFERKCLRMFSVVVSAFNSSKFLLARRKQGVVYIDDGYVDIELPDQMVDENENEMNFSLLDPNLLKARIITHLPKKHVTAIGAQAVFTCLTTVLFPAEVDWLLNGQLVEPTSDGRIYFSNNKRQLVILYMTSQEEGLLEVTARNKFGWEKSQCALTLTQVEEKARKTKALSE